MLFGRMTPEEAERQRVAERLMQRDAQGWKGLQTATEAELEELANQARSVINFDAPWNTPEQIQRAYAVTMDAVRQERQRRTKAREKERMRRNGMKAVFTAQLNGMQLAACDFKTALDELPYDELLGPAPKPARVTATDAQRMGDEELARATAEAKEQAKHATPYAQDVPALESFITSAQAALAEVRRRAAQDAKTREAARANLATLTAEAERRAAQREREEAERAELDGDLAAVVADLRKQVAELKK